MNRAKRNCKMLRKRYPLYWRDMGIKLDDEGIFVDAGQYTAKEFYGFTAWIQLRRFIKDAQTYKEVLCK